MIVINFGQMIPLYSCFKINKISKEYKDLLYCVVTKLSYIEWSKAVCLCLKVDFPIDSLYSVTYCNYIIIEMVWESL